MYNLGLIAFEIPPYVFTWPMLLVVFGILFLLKKRWISGLLLIGIGKYFLIPDVLGIPLPDPSLMWPVLVVLLGVFILMKPAKVCKTNDSCHKIHAATNQNTDNMDSTVIFGGENKQISSYDFKGGKITAIFGGSEIDLSNCCLSKENKSIELLVIFGGVTLIVPKEWNVQTEITPIMGGVEDNINTMPDIYIDPVAEIILKGTVIMGGVEIKRV